VLEANRVAWGCSTRNGGQGQNASGRLTRSQWIARWGQDTALRLHAEIQEGFELFSSLIAEFPCDAQPGGHLYIAHRHRTLKRLTVESEVANRAPSTCWTKVAIACDLDGVLVVTPQR